MNHLVTTCDRKPLFVLADDCVFSVVSAGMTNAPSESVLMSAFFASDQSPDSLFAVPSCGTSRTDGSRT